MDYQIPLVARGEVIFSDMEEHGGRINDLRFRTPDASKHLRRIVVSDCGELTDLYGVRLDEIFDYLVELGSLLDIGRNAYLQEAYEISRLASNLPDGILRHIYESRLQPMFVRGFMEDLIEAQIGRSFLEGWVPHKHFDGRIVHVRAFGSRAVHIVPGNLPMAAATQILRAALTRSDIIIKSPSNDPATPAAIVRTMIDLDRKHPVTRHAVAAYWKGGDSAVEDIIYNPQFIDRIMVWGGEASINHVRRFLQPGLTVHPFDPKYSNSIIGCEIFVSDELMREAAFRLACDIGGFNQEGCVNARIVFVECDMTSTGIARLNTFAEYVYQAMMDLPDAFSSPSKINHAELQENVENLAIYGEGFRVIGGKPLMGAIIVSQSDETVEFARLLEGRVANLVPVANLDIALSRLTHASQTIGVYPDSLRERIRDRAAVHGAQRITSLGYATAFSISNRLDAVEPLREMCRWVIDEHCSPDAVLPPWTVSTGYQGI